MTRKNGVPLERTWPTARSAAAPISRTSVEARRSVAIQNAAAQESELLLAEAARRLDLPPEALRTEHGAVEPELSELPASAQQSDDYSH